MSIFPPLSVWDGSDGSELSLSNNAVIDTEASKDLTTEAGLSLIIDDATSTIKPLTVWSTNNAS